MSAASKINDYRERVFVTTNEINHQQTLQAYKQLAPRPGTNAIWGCSGTFILDLASISPGSIEYLSVFDLSSKVADFWKNVSLIIPQLDPQDLKFSQALFFKFVTTNYEQKEGIFLSRNLDLGVSFLSTKQQLAKICTLFKKGNFSFQQLDLLNPKQLQRFLKKEQKKGAIPYAIYLSNIAQCIDTAGTPNRTFDPKIIKRMVYSLNLLPRNAIFIDAFSQPGQEWPLQRIHSEVPVPLRNLLPVALEQIFPHALVEDDYDYVRLLVAHGVNPKGYLVDEQGRPTEETYFMFAYLENKSHAIRALRDSQEEKGRTRLTPAAPLGQANTLVNPHVPVRNRQQDNGAAKALLALKANPDPLPLSPMGLPLGQKQPLMRTLVDLKADVDLKV